VGAEAFKDLTGLGKVEIAAGDTALKLSNGAFEGCGITNISIPARVWYIGEYTLGSCQNLQNIHVDSGNAAYTRDMLEAIFVDPDHGDYRLKENSIVYELIPDFEQLPIEKMGRE